MSRSTVQVTRGGLVAVVAALVLALGLASASLWVAADRSGDAGSGQSGQSAGAASGGACDAAAVSERVLPSVVTIHARSADGKKAGNGTGEFMDNQGRILTNDHVIAIAADRGALAVVLADGTQLKAEIVGRAAQLDLAVLKVSETAKSQPISRGDSSTLKVGQPTVALGAPLGLSGTVTSGIISALGRQLPIPDESGQTTGAHITDALQTDAAINPGNSGGPLVDCAGRMVGVNTAIATVPTSGGEAGGGNVGIGFAIPANTAKAVYDRILKSGSFTPVTLGVVVSGISSAGSKGLYVQAVVNGGAAQKAGLQVGDVLTAIDGNSDPSYEDLVTVAVHKKQGDTVRLQYVRGGRTHSATARLS